CVFILSINKFIGNCPIFVIFKEDTYYFIFSARGIITNVITTGARETIDSGNTSDDDVIEVVRDEAPIEILSDGEEMELENTRKSCIQQNFEFTTQTPESTSECKTMKDDEANFNFIDIENSVNPEHIFAPVISNTVSLENKSEVEKAKESAALNDTVVNENNISDNNDSNEKENHKQDEVDPAKDPLASKSSEDGEGDNKSSE
ncbi:probable myosin-binding protein 4, partial [Colias croceus]|uniref:probable myosin-binding protein 4 n=1 Tax=Colias crocea TaxID=72248 RepID=UPI001E27DCB2